MKSVQQKYDEAAARNVYMFLKKGGKASIFLDTLSKNKELEIPARYKSLENMKHSLGIRLSDTKYDTPLLAFWSILSLGL